MQKASRLRRVSRISVNDDEVALWMAPFHNQPSQHHTLMREYDLPWTRRGSSYHVVQWKRLTKSISDRQVSTFNSEQLFTFLIMPFFCSITSTIFINCGVLCSASKGSQCLNTVSHLALYLERERERERKMMLVIAGRRKSLWCGVKCLLGRDGSQLNEEPFNNYVKVNNDLHESREKSVLGRNLLHRKFHRILGEVQCERIRLNHLSVFAWLDRHHYHAFQ